MEYLELRQRFKESIREKMNKKSGTALANLRYNNNKNNDYGSFFGPSETVIAQRVIQESKPLFENPLFAANLFKSNQADNKGSASSTLVRSKALTNGQPRKVLDDALRTKLETLKYTRDYSFLLSDDIEFPAPAKDTPCQSHVHKQFPSKVVQSSISKQHSVQKKEVQGSRKEGKIMPKQTVSASKPQLKQPPCASLRVESPKKKPMRLYPDDDDGAKAISMIRRMFGYDPNKYRDDANCDTDMVSGFNDVLKEERRSAMIAKREDAEELRKIEEEEERREQLRREAKKRKVNQR